MSYLIKALILLCAFVAQVSMAQQVPSTFAYSEIVLKEQAVESPKVAVVYSEASGIVEIRFQECDECETRALPPAVNIRFSAGQEEVPVGVAAERYRNRAGTVFFDRSTLKVNRVQYFKIRNGGVDK